MIANISMSVASFEETVNTLKYANRAKNIKTTVTRNVLNVNHHISEYVALIANLRQEITNLKAQLMQHGIPSPTALDINRTKPEKGTLREARGQIMKYFHERMQLRRQLLELENKNVTKSIEIGQHQLVVAEHERRREEKEEEKATQDARIEFEEFLDDEADIAVAKIEISRLQDEIKELSADKSELTRKLRQTERAAEEFRAALEHTITSDEKRELLLMEYRIGKLELDNMELEQTRTVQETLSRGKDLTVEKLKLQLRLRDKIIQKQQAILDQHDLGHEVRYGILDTLEDATLTDGFDTLRLSMERISSPCPTQIRVPSDHRKVVLPDIVKASDDGNHPLPSGRMSLMQYHLDKSVSLREITKEEPEDMLPLLPSRTKKKSAPSITAPYLKVLKHRRKKKPIAIKSMNPSAADATMPNL
ncbi:hypothetical protein Ae201684_003749 [Aphanomyces euteiches]|uniref:Kinesin motor domain-containing protein n=1 Tax=Aphanomyces euteiches TaxID=100861 RepID=A0A6G0XL15_9STRA|nr:hypothetical protein Ae201684_003749 [Aphanomyces euteiches]